MSIGINWKEIWDEAVWDPVWRQTAVVPPPEAPQTIAPSFGEFRVTKKRAQEFQKILDEGIRKSKDLEKAKAEALKGDKAAEEAAKLAAAAASLERARLRRESDILKSLLAKKSVPLDYPKEKLSGTAGLEPVRVKARIQAELPLRGGVRRSAAILGRLSGEHSLVGGVAVVPVITGRVSLEREDDAIALALGMPELTEVLGEFVRVG